MNLQSLPPERPTNECCCTHLPGALTNHSVCAVESHSNLQQLMQLTTMYHLQSDAMQQRHLPPQQHTLMMRGGQWFEPMQLWGLNPTQSASTPRNTQKGQLSNCLYNRATLVNFSTACIRGATPVLVVIPRGSQKCGILLWHSTQVPDASQVSDMPVSRLVHPQHIRMLATMQ